MATTQTSSANRNFNRPRFVNQPAVVANPALFQTVITAMGGVEKLASFLKAFTKKRYDTTGWRVVKDVTSRDTRHASLIANEPSTEVLAEPFQSLTAVLAAIVESKTEGKVKMVRDESLSVIATIRDDAAFLAANNIKLWDTYNENGGYMTLGMSALPAGQIPEIAKKQAMELEY